MNQNENEAVFQPESQPQQPRPRPRRRKPRKPPYKALAICAGIVFLVGFLFGFLIRGLFIPKPVQTAEETTEPSSQTTVPVPTEQLPAGLTLEDWRLKLVNKGNALEEGYSVELTNLPNGLQVDQRCYDDLMDMLEALEGEGLSPVICSAYRTVSDQEELFDRKVNELLNQGLSQEEAEKEASTVVAIPGTSEHHLGLAVDIVDESNQILDKSQEETAVQKWLMENCWDYGFILRYPNDKSDITGIIYEPWHYRYVGKEVARDIQSRGICFEEYLELMKG